MREKNNCIIETHMSVIVIRNNKGNEKGIQTYPSFLPFLDVAS
jgi:hypothetical protein